MEAEMQGLIAKFFGGGSDSETSVRNQLEQQYDSAIASVNNVINELKSKDVDPVKVPANGSNINLRKIARGAYDSKISALKSLDTELKNRLTGQSIQRNNCPVASVVRIVILKLLRRGSAPSDQRCFLAIVALKSGSFFATQSTKFAHHRIGQQRVDVHCVALQFAIGEMGDDGLLAIGCIGTTSRPPRLFGTG